VIGILFNPTARGEKALQFRERLSELGSAARVLPTRGPGDARVLAAELVRDGVQTVVAAGGDGTVNEVLNGLADVPGALDRTRLALIPLGTVNVLAKELGIPSDFDAAWRVIQNGRERRIDLPKAEFIGLDGRPETRHFALLAGTGLSTRSIEGVDWSLKKRHGQLAYILAGIRAMRPPYPVITVSCPERSVAGPLVEIGSGRYFGGRLELFPGTQVDDGQLGVTVVTRLNWITLIGTWARMALGRIRPSSVRQVFQTDRLQLSCSEPMGLHLDGDVVGTLPASITVRPRALRILAP
jgi:diacylglycerol kinase (ATP)